MTATYEQLVKTNAVAIKNETLLKKKVFSSQKEITTLNETNVTLYKVY